MKAQGGKHLSPARQTPEGTRRVSSTSDAAESECLAGQLHTRHRVPGCSGRGFWGSANHPFRGVCSSPGAMWSWLSPSPLRGSNFVTGWRSSHACTLRDCHRIKWVAEVKQQTQSGDCHRRGGDDSATSSSQDACSVMAPVLGKSTSLKGLSRLTAPTCAQRPPGKAQALLSGTPLPFSTPGPRSAARLLTRCAVRPLASSEGHLNVCVFVRIGGGFVLVTSTSCSY